ncbi:MAG: hypothetical protein FWF00_05570 [Endomicrobia bacterium]|nr:hypothetical protein [Endomicrobiia bacterium]MCL2507137.1 hypothetical protein [Endomicrobiia bacterium]
MIIRIKIFILSFFIVFSVFSANASAAHISYVNFTNQTVVQTAESSAGIVKHSSFVQISKDMFNVCVKVYAALQDDLFLTQYNNFGTAALKDFHKSINFAGYFSEAVVTAKKNAFFAVSRYFIDFPEIDNKILKSKYLPVFAASVFMLFLSALHKSSLPYSNFTYKYIK